MTIPVPALALPLARCLVLRLTLIPLGPLSDEKGQFNDEDGDGFAEEGETISYTTTVKNEGNVRISILAVSRTL
ncbi:unnamed protein product, partial [Discosporangium mesarthrocarpum]